LVNQQEEFVCDPWQQQFAEREREIAEESDSDGREFLTFENRTKS
jgi:hypothetical protein